MLKSQTKFNKAYLLTLARNMRYEKGIDMIQTRIDKIGNTTESLLQKAFFQYHHAADLKYNNAKRNTAHDLEIINNKFKKAQKICLEIIENKNVRSKNQILNARLYLAQIYAMLGKEEDAESLTKQTFKLFPSTLTSERVADIYFRLGEYKIATYWYSRAVKLARKTPEKLIAELGLAITYRKMGLLNKANKIALLALTIPKSLSKNKNVILLIESLYEHFPKLKKQA